MPSVLKCRAAMIAGLLVGASSESYPQTPTAAPADVGTIADIVRASYEVISGPAGARRQWQRDSTLYMAGATFVSVSESDGRVQTTIMTPEDYRRGFDANYVARGIGLYETEVGRRIERYGHVAQVRSVAVVRRTPNGPIDARYVNYFQLYWDGSRWWIAGMVWDKERPTASIPDAWVGRWEEVTQ